MRADTARVRTDNFELGACLEKRCHVCGCTETQACPGGCHWVEDDLCSACAGNRRDPREDPQPGDVLAVGTDVREVWERIGGNVEYSFPRKSTTRWLSLIRWQSWARHAEVKKVAA